MRQKDVIVGATYLTRVVGALRQVVVIQVRQEPPRGEPCIAGHRTVYAVRLVGSDRVLAKFRTASALHPLPKEKNPT